MPRSLDHHQPGRFANLVVAQLTGAEADDDRLEARLRLASLRQTRKAWQLDDYDVVAEELSQLAEKMRAYEDRLAEVERVNASLEVPP